MMEKRLREAQKLGFKKAYIPEGNTKGIDAGGLDVVQVKSIEPLLERLFLG
jgi:predicted ATP-dependent serine protease